MNITSAKIYTIIFSLISLTISAQSCQEIFGLNVNSGNVYLSEINAQSGVVSNITSNSIGQLLLNNTSTIDPINQILYFYSVDGITGVNLLTGNVIFQNPINNSNFLLATMVYNCADETIYGLNVDSGQIFLATIDEQTGNVTNISNISIGQLLINNTTSIDPINQILYFYSVDGITGVSLLTGSVVSTSPINNPDSFLATMVYNCQDSNFYGLNLKFGDFYLADINVSTGLVTNVSSSPVGQNLINNTSTLDPINEILYFYSTNGITTVDLNTGNIISQTPITNPNFILATMQTNCSACCIACNSNHGELMIQSIEGQND